MEKHYPRRDPEYGYPTLDTAIKLAVETTCTSLEILHSKAVGSTIPITEHKTAFLKDDESASEFLCRNLEDQTGLRLLMGACTYSAEAECSILPFSQPVMELAKECLYLPEEFDTAMRQRSARAFKASCPSSTCYVFKFSIYQPSYYQVALHHSPATHTTTALIIAKTSDHAFAPLSSSLRSYAHLAHDPFLLPVLIARLVTSFADVRIQEQDNTLNALEESMGQHVYINRPMGDPLTIDFVDTTRTLSHVGRVLQVEKMRAGALLLSLEFMTSERRLLSHESLAQQVGDMIENQKNFCQNLILRAESEEKRTEGQVSVVYQYMAQKDSKINISLSETSASIAESARQDSAAMKAVAVLTMCFLPGTFLAAIFAMPFFVWDSGGPILRNGFRIYWLIAIPLTLTVLLLWGMSIWLPWGVWVSRFRNSTALRMRARAGK